MKRFYIISLCLSLSLVTFASNRSEKLLARIAKEVLNAKLGILSTETRSGENIQMLYDSNVMAVAGYQNGGFVVLAKDDALNPVLGYSLSAYDAKNSNPGFQMWIRATEQALSESTPPQVAKPEGIPTEVTSYVSTIWNQSAPYNNLCPTYTSKGTVKHYPTGCVATAMAQAMYYYKYPEMGTGKHTYRFDPGTGVEETVSVQLEDYVFDWNNMLANYKSEYTDTQAKAVAELMMVCGASVEMQYTESGSGAQMTNAVSALRNNFGFDAGLPLHSISFESSEEYYPALYRAIASKIPVVYAGVSDQGGHCFILDGYDEEGLFSVNWGWGGSEDGMYAIQTLNGYAQDQQFIPVTNQGVYPQYSSKFTVYEGSVDFSKVDDTHLKMSTTGRPVNVDGDSYNGNLYVVAQNQNSGETKEIAKYEMKSAVPAYYYASDGNLSKPYITITNKLEDGEFRLFLASKSSQECTYSPFRTTDEYANSALMTIKDGVIVSISTDETAGWMATTGVSSIKFDAEKKKTNKVYNINGMLIDSNSHGLVIKGGKKLIQ